MPRPLLLTVAIAACGASAIAQAPAKPAVPLRTGLTIVTAIAEHFGDYESIKRITAVDDKGYTLSYAADVPEDPDEDLGPGEKPTMREVRGTRTVLAADLQGAHEYVQKFGGQQPRILKGSTALGVSAAVLTELKTRGESKITVMPEGIMGAIGGLLGGMLGGGDELGMAKMSGTLKLSKDGPKTLTVLVNGAQAALPVVHATVDFDEETSGDFLFHDDTAHPISLKFTIGDTDLRVVRIDFPAEAPAPASSPGPASTGGSGGGGGAGPEAATTSAATMEAALKTSGTFDVYGIYFDFASDRIKPESEPVLREIGKVMTDNPTWTLAVGGHTDNVGGTTYNLDLSKRRAAAVKQALVTRYKVAPARLEPNGYGAGSPKAPNTTMEGRAQNRRVELRKR
jgi:outer membrane protein OmpA-like peptidoglycan-associated protein